MLLRFIAENALSFKEATEFNLFPSSKSHSHEWHKVSCGHATAMRFSAIYGANGAGKSNLIELIDLLKNMVIGGELGVAENLENLRFKFDAQCKENPISMAIEFFVSGNVYYYQIEFDEKQIINESLLLSGKTKDVPIFKRESINSKVVLSFNDKFSKEAITDSLVDAFKRVLRPDMLLLSFLARFYPEEIIHVKEAFRWFNSRLQIVKPISLSGNIPHLMDTDKKFNAFVNQLLPEFKTGISKLEVESIELTGDKTKLNDEMQEAVAGAKQHPGEPQPVMGPMKKGIQNVVFENDKYYLKRLLPSHVCSDGKSVDIPFEYESDGTWRMIEYMPLFYLITKVPVVFMVDEMERSIHPILIKEMINKLSKDKGLKGQLIFSTHESHLLDQEIFRPDEIWFAEKDDNQATQLYPLSDYNIHKTANIENGYLLGRYGAIPFLSSLNQLHWYDDQSKS